MLSLRSTAIVCTVSASVGYVLGRDNTNDRVKVDWRKSIEKYLLHQGGSSDRDLQLLVPTDVETVSEQNTPSWYKFLPVPISVSAASAPLDRSSLPSSVNSSAVVSTPTNRVGEIMKFGYPNLDNVRFYENYVVSYDRRNRTAHWVFEHIKGEHFQYGDSVSREKSCFKEDVSVHPFFRATNNDYKGSGYDRGHLAAASNHRHSQKAMDQTFVLSNIAPQVGDGFNRSVWNNLEKYTRALARRNRCVYVCTGPLYLPRKEADGKQYVKYEVIGPNHVAVPTHFFKVLVMEDQQGQYEMKSFILPNQALSSDVKLKVYQIPVESIERAAGFLLFEKIPRKAFKLINGEKPR